MREFNTFAVGGKQHGMIADDVPAANGMKANLRGGAFAGQTGAAIDGDILEVPAVAGGGGVAKKERGAGGGIFLAAVVTFHNFAVVASAAQGVGSLFYEGIEQIDAGAHIGGQYDRDVSCGGGDGGYLDVVEPGGADDPGDAGGSHLGGGGSAGAVLAEVDGNIPPLAEGGIEIGRNRHAKGSDTGGAAGILANQGRPRAIQSGDDAEAGGGRGCHEAEDGLTHTAASAHQNELQGGRAHASRSSCCRVSWSRARLAVLISHKGRR